MRKDRGFASGVMAVRLGLASLGLAPSAGCERAEGCSQQAVDGCFAEVGCDGSATCALTVVGMNALCECLGDLGCDQDWYRQWCDDAPYPADAGCPMCEE